MRHAKKTIKLGRKSEHRNLLLANQVCSLIAHNRIKTTLAKAKAVRPYAERMVTLGKRGDLHARRDGLFFSASERSSAQTVCRTGASRRRAAKGAIAESSNSGRDKATRR